METVFSKIMRGEIPAKKIYEDDNVFVFLDNSPLNLGHTLVIPKNWAPCFLEMPDEMVSQVFIIAKKVAKAIKLATKADGINLIMNNGEAAGQVVGHAHLHIIPRFKEDGHKHWERGKKFNEEQTKEIQEKIKANLDLI